MRQCQLSHHPPHLSHLPLGLWGSRGLLPLLEQLAVQALGKPQLQPPCGGEQVFPCCKSRNVPLCMLFAPGNYLKIGEQNALAACILISNYDIHKVSNFLL